MKLVYERVHEFDAKSVLQIALLQQLKHNKPTIYKRIKLICRFRFQLLRDLTSFRGLFQLNILTKTTQRFRRL